MIREGALVLHSMKHPVLYDLLTDFIKKEWPPTFVTGPIDILHLDQETERVSSIELYLDPKLTIIPYTYPPETPPSTTSEGHVLNKESSEVKKKEVIVKEWSIVRM